MRDLVFRILETDKTIYCWWKGREIESFYRYYQLNENTLIIFRKHELFFATHKEFNDLFDLKIGFDNCQVDYNSIYGNSEIANLYDVKVNNNVVDFIQRYVGAQAGNLFLVLPDNLCNSEHIVFMADSGKNYDLLSVKLDNNELFYLREIIFYLRSENNLPELKRKLGLVNKVLDRDLRNVVNSIYVRDMVVAFKVFFKLFLEELESLLSIGGISRERRMLLDFLKFAVFEQLNVDL